VLIGAVLAVPASLPLFRALRPARNEESATPGVTLAAVLAYLLTFVAISVAVFAAWALLAT
jgi:hypothetical protein